jgi:hypothetical protein
MQTSMFTAEKSLYRGGYYAALADSYISATGHVVSAQVLPNCGSGSFTNCAPGTLPGCPTNCVQKCIDVTGPAPITRLECCPQGQCGGTGVGCCKTVCCQPTVS